MRWTLDTINWKLFEKDKLDPEILRALKAAALVEYNAPDYVGYLCNVFRDHQDVQQLIRDWGEEESQHGRALAAYARLADPDFDFEGAFARFRKLQNINTEVDQSLRGSKAGEMVARCVVESGTSSFYTAVRETTTEPCLKQLTANMAADEFAHYRLFLETFNRFKDELPHTWKRLRIAVSRVGEADDDELAGAYYCANYPEGSTTPYNRKTFADAYQKRALLVYGRQHVDRLISMVAKAGGLDPHGWLTTSAQHVGWWYLQRQQQRLAKTAV
jgi:rubrerythrin